MDSAKTLAVALILSRIDYCNALVAGLREEKNRQAPAYTEQCSTAGYAQVEAGLSNRPSSLATLAPC